MNELKGQGQSTTIISILGQHCILQTKLFRGSVPVSALKLISSSPISHFNFSVGICLKVCKQPTFVYAIVSIVILILKTRYTDIA